MRIIRKAKTFQVIFVLSHLETSNEVFYVGASEETPDLPSIQGGKAHSDSVQFICPQLDE